MIAALIVALFVSSGLAESQARSLPSFSWDGSRSSVHGIPHLVVLFPNGESDVALLERFNPIPVAENERELDVDGCIFRGHLQAEPDVYVAVTGGCPFSDTFEMTIPSTKLPHMMYSVKNGQVTGLDLPWGKGITDSAVEQPSSQGQTPHQKVAENRAAFPANGMVINIKVFSDASFRAKFGADSVNAMRRVMAQAQPFYYLKNSLTTTIRFNIVGTGEIAETINANNNDLNMVAKYSTDANIHANVYLCFENNSYGVVGLAWVGTTCSGTTGYRSGINEYFFTDAQSGGVVAHEMGHNLGMSHDFTGSGGARFDSKGQACTGVGGVMDYANPVKWSTCSVEDFTKYFNQFSSFCLPTDGSVPPTTTTTTTTTTLKCVPSWIGDTYCDDMNNNANCQYDGGDCCNNSNPDYQKYCRICACLNPSG